MGKTADLIAAHGPFGVSFTSCVGKTQRRHHVVDRRTHKTLCGKDPVTAFGIDLTTRRQIDCLRCYKLAFASVNARASHTPDTPTPNYSERV